MHSRKPVSLAVLVLLLGTATLQADVKLPAIFGDHMVLQQGIKLPVWGTADPGEQVTVQVGDETAKATADPQGKWRVDLAPFSAGTNPLTVTVTGKNSVTFSDVLVGEVWVCSGQSNMEFDLGRAHNAATVLPQANDSQIRFFRTARKTSLDPLGDLTGKWEVCTPATVGSFSAVAYFFASDLRHFSNKPVGLIGSYWGGMPAQAFTSLSGLEKDPQLKYYVDDYNKIRTDLPKATADYPAQLATYKSELDEWRENGGAAYEADVNTWKAALAASQANGQTPPPKPTPIAPGPKPPMAPEGPSNTPSVIFNGMIAPLIPFGIKGVIWYQGEANVGSAAEYRPLFAAMINDWREKWGEGDFPFLFVQLACLDAGKVPSWAVLRESQAKALALPNTGMATAVDIGAPHNIHPQDKEDVGHRLALAAEHIAYGADLAYSGPVYSTMQVAGSAVNLTFTHEDGGLIIGSAPWVATGSQPLPTDTLSGFTIAGADKNWVSADAKIVGDQVEVSSSQVSSPVAVRYDWANDPKGNLYNKAMLPAVPFRTDDWSDPAAEGTFDPK